MLEEGPGYLVRVEGTSRASVVHDHPLTTLSSNLCTLVTPGVIARGEPVVHVPSLEPCLQLPGGEVSIAISGNGLRNAPCGKIFPQDSDDVGGCVLRQLEQGQPVGVAIYHHQVGVRGMFKEVSTDVREWIGWVS